MTNKFEEFKMLEGEDDQEDLLEKKKNCKDMSEFYAKEDQIEELRTQLQMMQGMNLMGQGGSH